MKYLPTSDADRSEMLASIGVTSVDQLFEAIPAAVRQDPNLPPPLSEIEVRRLLEPTETEGKAGLDAFIHAMREIARETQEDPQIDVNARHTTPMKRVEVTAARKLILRWRP